MGSDDVEPSAVRSSCQMAGGRCYKPSSSLRGEPPRGLGPSRDAASPPCLDPSLLAGPVLPSLTCGDARISMPAALPVRLRTAVGCNQGCC